MTVADRLVELALLIWLLFALVHGWAWILLTAAISIPLWGVLKRVKAARREAERQEKARLIRHADEEDRLVGKGDVRGIYGDYMPPPSVRGWGLWLSGDS